MAVIAAAGIAAAASIFGSSKSAGASKDAANAQREAAQLQTLVARELHQHWKNYYAPCDIATIQEVCAVPPYVPQYQLWEGRSRLEILRSFGRARQQMQRCQDVYCVGRAAQQCNYLAGIEAVALVDSVNFGYRFEESQRIQLNQLRLQNIYNQLGLGRNLLQQSSAASGLASAAAYRLGAQAGQATNGWLQAAGWLQGESGKRLLGQVTEKLFPSGGGMPTPQQQTGTGGDFNSDNFAQMNNAGISEQGPSPVVDTGFGSTFYDSAQQAAIGAGAFDA